MKKSCTLFMLLLTSACGNTSHLSAPNRQSQTDLTRVTSGLVLIVKNALPQQQIGADRVKPHLNAFFCSPIPGGNTPIPRLEDRCIRMAGVINNGAEETFVISRQDLAQVYSRGLGMGAFEFADDHQLTSVAWPCSSPNNRVTLDSNLDIKQSWYVEVNQRFTLSYGCLIDRR